MSSQRPVAPTGRTASQHIDPSRDLQCLHNRECINLLGTSAPRSTGSRTLLGTGGYCCDVGPLSFSIYLHPCLQKGWFLFPALLACSPKRALPCMWLPPRSAAASFTLPFSRQFWERNRVQMSKPLQHEVGSLMWVHKQRAEIWPTVDVGMCLTPAHPCTEPCCHRRAEVSQHKHLWLSF